MHGTHRTAMRKNINAACAAREESRAKGKLKRVINSILHISPDFYDCDTLIDSQQRVLTDPQAVHEALTNYLDHTFKPPLAVAESKLQSPFNPQQAIHSYSYFRDLVQASPGAKDIPERYVRLVWQGLSHHTHRQELHQDLAQVFATTPTLADYMTSVKMCSANTSPGVSNLTFNMIKSWPPAIHTLCYTALAQMWTQDKRIPDYWKQRWILLKPKTSDRLPSIQDLRPLTLLECLRKLWEKIILSKLQTIWTKHQILQPSQHCTQGRSTANALLKHQAAIEDAYLNQYPLYISS